MKGKIFKRVASAMLGLMVAFAAIGVNTAFAEEVTIDKATVTATLTNFQNDGIAQNDKAHFDANVTFTTDDAEKDKGKTVKFTELKFEIKFADADMFNVDSNILYQPLFDTTGYQLTVTKKDTQTLTVSIVKVDQKAGPLEAVIGKLTAIVRITVVIKKTDVADQDQYAATTNDTSSVTAKNDKTNAKGQGAQKTANWVLCKHVLKYSNPTPSGHTATCANDKNPGCLYTKEEDHFTTSTKTVAGNAETLGGIFGKCPCGIFVETVTEEILGTETKYPSGADISTSPCLNFVENDEVRAEDVKNHSKGKAMRLEIASEKVVDGNRIRYYDVYAGNKKLEVKDNSLRSLHVLRDGETVEQFTELYKKFGGQGKITPKEITLNGKRYAAVWSNIVGPCVVPTSAAKEEAKKSTTSKSGKSAKTGDAAGMVCLAASGLLVVAGLYMELMKKKKNA